MGAVNTTYTFAANDTITSTKMNNIIDDTIMTGEAIIGNTLAIASNKLKVNSQGITSNELAEGAVASTKIAAGAVTYDKLSNGGPSWTTTFGAIPNFQISGDYNFYQTTERSSDGYSAFHFGSQSGSHVNATIRRNSGVNGSFDIEQVGTGQLRLVNPNGQTTIFSPNGLTLYKDGSNAANFPVPAGTAPIYGARAWVNFYGVGTVGANMTIRAAGNVSSVNKTATGVYRVTFATAMPDANYAAIVGSDANSPHKIGGVVTQAASYVDIAYSQINTSSARENPDWGQVTIFR